MTKITTIFILLLSTLSYAQENAFKSGEWFKFHIHYGVFTASYATVQLQEKTFNGHDVFHVTAHGKSTGLLSLFFKVNDKYQSYFDVKTGNPYRFIRKINEGGYKKNIEIAFNNQNHTAIVNDKKHKVTTTHSIKKKSQDMISAFYYLRNNVDTTKLIVGEEIKIDMFFDKENYDFKMKFLGREILKTKFGKVSCLKFRPYVQSGRVFKEQESLSVWISDDQNKIPIRIQADLAVGSLKADLVAYKGLKKSFKIIVSQ